MSRAQRKSRAPGLKVVHPAAPPKKRVRLWSPSRPRIPDTDPLYEQIVAQLLEDRRSYWEKADQSGLSQSTLRNWERGKVKQPKGISLQMAAQMLGGRIVFMKR